MELKVFKNFQYNKYYNGEDELQLGSVKVNFDELKEDLTNLEKLESEILNFHNKNDLNGFISLIKDREKIIFNLNKFYEVISKELKHNSTYSTPGFKLIKSNLKDLLNIVQLQVKLLNENPNPDKNSREKIINPYKLFDEEFNYAKVIFKLINICSKFMVEEEKREEENRKNEEEFNKSPKNKENLIHLIKEEIIYLRKNLFDKSLLLEPTKKFTSMRSVAFRTSYEIKEKSSRIYNIDHEEKFREINLIAEELYKYLNKGVSENILGYFKSKKIYNEYVSLIKSKLDEIEKLLN